jgi:hypothetical protein
MSVGYSEPLSFASSAGIGTDQGAVNALDASSGNNVTLTAAQMLGGFLKVTVSSADDDAVTTPTAALFVAALPAEKRVVGATGTCVLWNADAAQDVELTAGSGFTLVGEATVGETSRVNLQWIVTNATSGSEAVTLLISPFTATA